MTIYEEVSLVLVCIHDVCSWDVNAQLVDGFWTSWVIVTSTRGQCVNSSWMVEEDSGAGHNGGAGEEWQRHWEPQSRRKYLLCVCDILIQLSRAGPGTAFFPIIPGPGKLIHQTWHRWHIITRGHGNGARYIELELSINTMNDNSTITSCF